MNGPLEQCIQKCFRCVRRTSSITLFVLCITMMTADEKEEAQCLKIPGLSSRPQISSEWGNVVDPRWRCSHRHLPSSPVASFTKDWWHGFCMICMSPISHHEECNRSIRTLTLSLLSLSQHRSHTRSTPVRCLNRYVNCMSFDFFFFFFFFDFAFVRLFECIFDAECTHSRWASERQDQSAFMFR